MPEQSDLERTGTWGEMAVRVHHHIDTLRAAGQQQLADDVTHILADSADLGMATHQTWWRLMFTVDKEYSGSEERWFDGAHGVVAYGTETVIYTQPGVPTPHMVDFESRADLARAYHWVSYFGAPITLMRRYTARNLPLKWADIDPAALTPSTATPARDIGEDAPFTDLAAAGIPAYYRLAQEGEWTRLYCGLCSGPHFAGWQWHPHRGVIVDAVRVHDREKHPGGAPSEVNSA